MGFIGEDFPVRRRYVSPPKRQVASSNSTVAMKSKVSGPDRVKVALLERNAVLGALETEFGGQSTT
jgi:hypothetical protein